MLYHAQCVSCFPVRVPIHSLCHTSPWRVNAMVFVLFRRVVLFCFILGFFFQINFMPCFPLKSLCHTLLGGVHAMHSYVHFMSCFLCSGFMLHFLCRVHVLLSLFRVHAVFSHVEFISCSFCSGFVLCFPM